MPKNGEEIRCPICMEHPHNAVLLQCSSFGKGCRPYMCNTSYRHSNCLDQFRKSSVPSPSTELLQETTSVSNNRTGEELELLGQTRHYESGLQPKLCCPLCRGEIYGWTVVKPAREFMNSRLRSCSLETCDFSGNYSELRKHSRSEHPFIQPSKVDPQRQLDWTNFEYERYVEDMAAMFALTMEEQEEPDWTNFEYERDVEDMAAMFALTMEEQEEPDWTNFEYERDVEMAAMFVLTMEEQEEPDWTNFEYERDVEDMAAMYALTMEEQEEPDWTMEEQEEPDWTNFEHERDVEDMAAMLALTRGTRGAL
ncbi:DUF1644 FAMILY PROTEIN [Salix purpurea]|uniref:DUF1644 FAMILY PROTEIN n=1 Tax=Salix purpurea TaxID=77065 RepID=A0A9Q0THH8_SALPP|nr:DUF1644 FAMILY PROTEIN [Salix purpurea]